MPRPTVKIRLTMGPSEPPPGVARLAESVREMQAIARRYGAELTTSVTTPDGLGGVHDPVRAAVKSLEECGRKHGVDTEVEVTFTGDPSAQG